MSRATHSVAMAGELSCVASKHLLRPDGQEDVCFALWHPSNGRSRSTALIQRLLLPESQERNVHGNASFEPAFFERALFAAAAEGAGLALLHSHPRGTGWQGMSWDDISAEQGNAAAVFGATGLPFVGLTLGGDGGWSGRHWLRTGPREYSKSDCATVRVVGEQLTVSYMDQLAPAPIATKQQRRTVSAWGEKAQADLTRLRVGIVGSGSVGGFIGDALVRTGVQDIMLFDFDRVELHNLDRLTYATVADIGRLKVRVQAKHLAARATANTCKVEPISAAVFEEKGFRAALDCDVLFSCVDRPWGRHVLNLIAYAHLIPVIDGGISVRTNRLGQLIAADWRAHTATVGRQCLQCLNQYDPGLVQTEREGSLEDPSYIAGLPKDHALKAGENVFAFSMSCASMQTLQFLAFALAPLGRSNPGAQRYHFVGDITEPACYEACNPECLFPALTGLGDHCHLPVTGPRPRKINRGQIFRRR